MLDFHLNHSAAASNCFLQMNMTSKLEFVKQLFIKCGENTALSGKYFAPYLLVQLIDKKIFMKLQDFTVYRLCLENSTPSDLEELSKISELEDQFVRFLKYIEILASGDIKKQEG